MSLLARMPDQSVLSDRVKPAIKTALATVLAYGIALSLNWENAHWAAFAVAFCTLSTVGESLNKGLLRLSGTIVGSVAAVTLIALFPQDRWQFLIGMSIYTGFCAYMMPGTPDGISGSLPGSRRRSLHCPAAPIL